MRIVLRCDGGIEQGTGHIMRCLTLAEEATSRGHEVILLTGPIDVEWLDSSAKASGVTVRRCVPDTIDIGEILSLAPDWVVVDSYRFGADEVNSLAQRVGVLALVDGDDRGLETQLYLDQNLGAESSDRADGRHLLGAKYALVREAVLRRRRDQPWQFPANAPRLLSVMGGSDPTHASLAVARALAEGPADRKITMVVPDIDCDEVRAAFTDGRPVQLVPPTPALPDLLAEADILISAAGTSALDACALGLPAVLISVVDNQQSGLEKAIGLGLALGIDARKDHDAIRDQLPMLLDALVTGYATRQRLSIKCQQTVDGFGKQRVIECLESLLPIKGLQS